MRKTLNRKQIDAIFEASINQSEACVALYRLAFHEWDELKSIEGWQWIGKEAGLYITKRFMEFDRKHHPDVFNGGLWMNNGFSTCVDADVEVGPWELCTDNCITS